MSCFSKSNLPAIGSSELTEPLRPREQLKKPSSYAGESQGERNLTWNLETFSKRDKGLESKITGEDGFTWKTYVTDMQNVFSMGSIIPITPPPNRDSLL